MAEGHIVQIMHFFDMKIGQFRKEWAELTEADKEQLRGAIENGTLTY